LIDRVSGKFIFSLKIHAATQKTSAPIGHEMENVKRTQIG